MDQLARWMISTTRESARCIYENEDILVEHRVSTYTDGERSATMLVHLKKDGLLWRTETGSTPVEKSKDNTLNTSYSPYRLSWVLRLSVRRQK